MAITDAPTGELGAPGIATVGGWLDTYEDTPELMFPASAKVYDAMRRDAQLDSVLRAITLPLRRTRWRLVGDEVRPEVAALVRDELGLDEDGRGRRRRRRQGVVFAELLRNALLMLPFGFMPLEQVYELGPPAPGVPATGNALVAHLRKLGPRMPRSLTNIDVARDGGLTAVRQTVPRRDGLPGHEEVTIPVDRLVMFVNDREGGEWQGRSIFRSAYGHWLIKQRLMRLGPVIVERNGMGVPVVYYPADGSKSEALSIATAFRAGEKAGAALPEGYRLELVATTGQTRDELPLLQYHDEAMGRAALAMFLNLGHDNGARALGDTFVDYFVLALGAIVEEVEATVTEHVIRDLVALNYGEEEAYPELVADELTAESTPTAEALKALADAGLLGPVDDGLTGEVRRRYGLPALPELPAAPVTDVGQPGGELVPFPGAAAATDGAAELAQRAAAVAQRAAQLAARAGS